MDDGVRSIANAAWLLSFPKVLQRDCQENQFAWRILERVDMHSLLISESGYTVTVWSSSDWWSTVMHREHADFICTHSDTRLNHFHRTLKQYPLWSIISSEQNEQSCPYIFFKQWEYTISTGATCSLKRRVVYVRRSFQVVKSMVK